MGRRDSGEPRLGRTKQPTKPRIHPNLLARAEDYTKVIDKIEEYLSYWSKIMGLSEWSFNVNYEIVNHEEGEHVKASVNPSWEYQAVYIRFFLPQLRDFDDYGLEHTVVHELSHCLVDQMEVKKQTRKEDIEAVVVNISRILLKTKYFSKVLRKK